MGDLTASEVRAVIADHALNICAVARNNTHSKDRLLQTIKRMQELAETLPEEGAP